MRIIDMQTAHNIIGVRGSFIIPENNYSLVYDLISRLGGQVIKEENEDIAIIPPMPEQERVGKMLKGLRYRAGLTQKELAKVLCVPQSHISQYEANKRKIPADKAQELAKVLNTIASHFEIRG